VFPRPAVGRLSVFSFLEGLSHGTVLVQALAEEVPAGPAAQIDTRSPTLAESGLDRLTVNALDGDDILIGGLEQNVLDAAPGDDTVIQ
jgi:hypothetical protein